LCIRRELAQNVRQRCWRNIWWEYVVRAVAVKDKEWAVAAALVYCGTAAVGRKGRSCGMAVPEDGVVGAPRV
jgi:hypothetical protein